MRRLRAWLFAALCAPLGVVFVWVAMRVSERFALMPQLPSEGGEEDFILRTQALAGIVWIGFCALTTWIGWTAAYAAGLAALRFLGLILGTGLTGLMGAAMLRALVSGRDDLANVAIVSFFVSWVLTSFFGALLLPPTLRLFRRSRERRVPELR